MKKILALLLTLAMVFTFVSCGKTEETTDQDGETTSATEENHTEEGPYTVTDYVGREVEFDKKPETVVAMGHGVLKTYVYMCGDENLVGIENAEISGRNLEGQSIHYAYPKLREIEVVGNGGPKFMPDYEVLSHLNPDVIFCAYQISPEEYDELQEKTKSKVIALDMGTARKVFDDPVYKNFDIIGQVMQKEERAKELNSYIKEIEEDLKGRNLSPEGSPEVYIGGCSYRGEQGILSTKSSFELLDLVGVKNVMDQITDEESIIIDKEKLTELNPELILLDLSGKSIIDEDIQKDPDLYNHLEAFKKGEVYTIMPYFTYGMNFDTAILDMYYIGKLIHPEKFEDINLEEKAEESYQVFVGEDVYQNLIEYYPEAFKEFKI